MFEKKVANLHNIGSYENELLFDFLVKLFFQIKYNTRKLPVITRRHDNTNPDLKQTPIIVH